MFKVSNNDVNVKSLICPIYHLPLPGMCTSLQILDSIDEQSLWELGGMGRVD